MLMFQERQLSLVTTHPYFPFCRYIILHFISLQNIFGLYFSRFLLRKSFPCNYLSKEYGMGKASDLLLGDHVCEKSDAIKWIECPRI